MKDLCENEWKKLRILHLFGNSITDEGGLAILQNKWPELE